METATRNGRKVRLIPTPVGYKLQEIDVDYKNYMSKQQLKHHDSHKNIVMKLLKNVTGTNVQWKTKFIVKRGKENIVLTISIQLQQQNKKARTGMRTKT